MDSQTLVYVNDVGRPTVVDLATGDQRELLVAAGRALDTFLVLDGKVVTKDPERSVLPLAGEEPFEVTVYRTESGISGPQSVDPIRDVTGPTLCLDAHGCNGRVVTQGGYSLVSGTAMVIGESWPGSGDPGTVEIVGNFIDSPGWTTKGRWTLFSMSSDPQAEPVQLPTPMAETTVWVFTQRSQHRNPGRE
jgi:hypothetical protein